ncbi:hypothetical protein WR25_23135 [Diploscapter pachys]|uniref:XPA C-terminal domain-containing protein n=1 Tax=Diploscapter pachys TaxID=2018661 RepID=A0A2A2JG20_9BILA|nr:hypothetical protein WR25_23135 [Diploscapter pachys]
MSKRRYDPSEDRTPIVEKLYRANQESHYSAGGFCDDDDAFEERRERIAESRQKRADNPYVSQSIPDSCIECNQALFDSWLWDRFSHPVCDSCRDDKNKHKLLARTEVKNTYLLKDCDLDLRKPPLRFYSKKNPHNPRYGDMKLYLKCQVIERVKTVFGSWEKYEEEKKLRDEQKETKADRKFDKKLNNLRQQMKESSRSRVKTDQKHEHVFGEENYNEEKDEYEQTCKECGFVNRYEKM